MVLNYGNNEQFATSLAVSASNLNSHEVMLIKALTSPILPLSPPSTSALDMSSIPSTSSSQPEQLIT